MFRRCLVTALVVGTLLTFINQIGEPTAMRVDLAFLFRTISNYVVPFVVSNVGAMSAGSD